MRNIELNTIKNKDTLLDFLEEVESSGFSSREFLENAWRRVEAAVNQQFVSLQELLVSRVDTGSPSVEQLFGQELDAADIEFKLYVPFLARMAEGWVGHLRRVGIPVNRQFFRIKFDYHGALSINYPYLVSVFEDAWQDFLNTAFHRIKAVSILTKGQKQSVLFGNTVLGLDYDKDYGLVTAKVVNIKRFAVYPGRDDISRSVHIIKSNVPLSDLRARLDLDQEALDLLEPQRNIQHVDATTFSQDSSTEIGETEYFEIPYGHVELTTFFVPFWRDYKSEDKKKFELKNAIILLGKNHERHGDKPRTVLLKVFELDHRDQNPFVFSTFSPTLPSVVYDRGKLVQYTPYQALMNLLAYAAARGVALSVNPPLLVKDDGKGTTDTYQVAPGAMWPVNAADDITALQPQTRLDHFLSFIEWVERAGAKGIGITELLEGAEASSASSRKTATQAVEERKSGEVRIDYIAEHQNDNYFQPFVYKYALTTQLYMQIEVENAQNEWERWKLENPNTQENDLWGFILGKKELAFKSGERLKNPCPLLKNFLVFSNIEKRIAVAEAQHFANNPQLLPVEFTENQLYEALVEPILATNVIVEGSTSEITKREQRQDFLDFQATFLTPLDTPPAPGMPSKLQQAGMQIDAKELARVGSKLFSIPAYDILKPITQPQGIAPATPMFAEGQGLQGTVTETSPTAIARETPQEQVPVEGGMTQGLTQQT